ncbi:hypothetical protein GCM10027028_43540 [Streptomyces sundarbansensis]
MPSPAPRRQSVRVCQKRLSTRAAGVAEGAAGADGAADEGAAAETTVPALAAAASAAVRTVLREVGLVMGRDPRSDAEGGLRVPCRAVRCDALPCGAVRCGAVRCGAVRCGAVRCGASTIPFPGRIGPAVRQPSPNP